MAFGSSGHPPIEKFKPIEILAELSESQPDWTAAARLEVGNSSLPELRALNSRWVAQPKGMKQAVAMIVLVNEELTRRGIGPAWRGLPRTVKTPEGQGQEPRMGQDGVMLLGGALKTKVLLRWVDLQWLRVELGPNHRTKFRSWDQAFSEDDVAASRGFEVVNQARWSSGRLRPLDKWKTLNGLLVPAPHRRALAGLMDTAASEVVATIRKRLEDRIRPRMNALLDQPRLRLTPALIEKRMVYAEAIELAEGSPANAAQFYRWMTGIDITRQSMMEFKTKIGGQCKLTNRSWSTQ